MIRANACIRIVYTYNYKYTQMKKLAGFGCCRMIAGFRAARRNIVYNDGGGCKYGLIPLRVMVRLNYYVVGISLYEAI